MWSLLRIRRCHYVRFSSSLPQNYRDLRTDLLRLVGPNRVTDNPFLLLAYGTDASVYRYVPKLVVDVKTEPEVSRIVQLAREHRTPLTFRAAGTSISGQAVTDSVLVRIVPSSWNGMKVLDSNGSHVRLQPGVLGGRANRILLPYGKKIGPDPSSIDSCMVGGIVANNSSGLCCGIANNAYATIGEMRIVFADGSVLDTELESSRREFLSTHAKFISSLTELSHQVKNNEVLFKKITHKYSIKNTTGYTLNALIDFDDPFEIIKHLMVGSEGTLGFISSVTLKTVDELPHKSSSLILFPNVESAAKAVEQLKLAAPVDAVEIMDRASLRAAESTGDFPHIPNSDDNLSALLVETRARDPRALSQNIDKIIRSLSSVSIFGKMEFTTTPEENAQLWKVRKGLFASVGAMRPPNTTIITEDVAVAVTKLAPFVTDLRALLKQHYYDNAIIFGHARDGNLHIVFSQSYDSPQDVDRYRHLMSHLCHMVAIDYDGSLKAEHGTGRNIAPFVELEWGQDAYQVMWRIKRLFDPDLILNPGVVLNTDPEIHLKNLKAFPIAHPVIDACIECGLCERNCPSREVTVTPRQRIVGIREISRLEREVERGKGTVETKELLKNFKNSFSYHGDATCAADGMCATSCPVSINTGKFIKQYRAQNNSPTKIWLARQVAQYFGAVTWAARPLLSLVHGVSQVIGEKNMSTLSDMGNKMFSTPNWNPYLPKGSTPIDITPTQNSTEKVVYFPCCVNRIMAPHPQKKSGDLSVAIHEIVKKVLLKAGYDVVYPKHLDKLCCGMAFLSKGFPDLSKDKAEELIKVLQEVSNNGKLPILFDMSPCLHHIKNSVQSKLLMMETVQFANKYLLNRLTWVKKNQTVSIHVPCSSKQMGLAPTFHEITSKCAQKVIDTDIPCCGMAGDRGLQYPELPRSALTTLQSNSDVSRGYCNSRTCEIALSLHTGVPYQSIFYLVDECTQPLVQDQ